MVDDTLPRFPSKKPLQYQMDDEFKFREMTAFIQEVGRCERGICLRCRQRSCIDNDTTSSCMGWLARNLLKCLGLKDEEHTVCE